MRLSQLIGQRFKQRPAEAQWDSHALLLRGGYMRPMPQGGFGFLPPGSRLLRHIEAVFTSEWQALGGQTLRLGTHASSLDLLCNELQSYSQLPCSVYHAQTVHNAATRSYGGLLQNATYTRQEFLSFHRDEKAFQAAYDRVLERCHDIFVRMGLDDAVLAAAGERGHAFFMPLEGGEDVLVTSEDSSSSTLLEAACSQIDAFPAALLPLEKVHTPGCKSIEEVANFLELPQHQCAKVVFFASDKDGKLVVALIRGDRDVNEAKLARIIGTVPVPAEDDAILAAGATPGYASPMGLDPGQVRIVVDHSIAGTNNLVAGANDVDYHFINFNLERDLPGVETVDIDLTKEGDTAGAGSGEWQFQPGIILGTLWKLDAPETMTYTDESGKEQAPYILRWAVGLERLAAVIAELHHDKFGPKWPVSIAPWQIHLCVIDYSDPAVQQAAKTLYADLNAAGYAVLLDNRGARPGVQFADADLLGAPLRFILSASNLENNEVEWKRRDTGESGRLPMHEVCVEGSLNCMLGDL